MLFCSVGTCDGVGCKLFVAVCSGVETNIYTYIYMYSLYMTYNIVYICIYMEICTYIYISDMTYVDHVYMRHM